MSDLVSREQAIKAMQESEFGYTYEVDVAIEAVKALPSVEPERKKGRWAVQLSTGEDRPYIWWKCTVCGHVIYSETKRDRKEYHAYCGRCGAEME